MMLGDLVKFGPVWKGSVQLSLRTVITLGLMPKAAHFSQNRSSLAPTGRTGTTVGTFVTRFTELNLPTQEYFYSFYCHMMIRI